MLAALISHLLCVSEVHGLVLHPLDGLLHLALVLCHLLGRYCIRGRESFLVGFYLFKDFVKLFKRLIVKIVEVDAVECYLANGCADILQAGLCLQQLVLVGKWQVLSFHLGDLFLQVFLCGTQFVDCHLLLLVDSCEHVLDLCCFLLFGH